MQCNVAPFDSTITRSAISLGADNVTEVDGPCSYNTVTAREHSISETSLTLIVRVIIGDSILESIVFLDVKFKEELVQEQVVKASNTDDKNVSFI